MTNPRHSADQRRAVDVVEPGYFRMRLVRGGWQVPCKIERGAAGWQATIDGFTHPPDPDPWRAEGVSGIHAYGERIDRQTYSWLLRVKAWAVENHPDHPALEPRRRMEPSRLRPLYPRTSPQWSQPPY